MVCPHLDYAVPAWSPHLRKDIDLIEKVQRRFIRMIPGYSELSYEANLKKLNLTTLEVRRTMADLLEVLKIFKGHTRVDTDALFKFNDTSTRRLRHKLFKRRSRLDVRKYLLVL